MGKICTLQICTLHKSRHGPTLAKFGHSLLVCLGGGMGLWGGMGLALAQVPPTSALALAMCLNDWPRAIALVGPLIAQDTTSPSDRQALLNLRRQLEQHRQARDIFAPGPQCQALLEQLAAVQQVPGESLDWATALESLALLSGQGFRNPITVEDRQRWGERAAQLVGRYEATEIPSLSPAIPLGTTTGAAVSTGFVSTQAQVFTFFGAMGDRVDVAIEAVRVLPGALYTRDDTQVFLFDDQGRLLAQDDDTVGFQSRLGAIPLPRSGRYFIAVTTFRSVPQLDSQGRIIAWEGIGGGAVEYTLTLRGVTPPDQWLPGL